MRNILLFPILVLLLSSCEKRTKVDIDEEGAIVVHINMNDIQNIDIDQLADSVSYVKLEINDDCVIGNIRKVIFFENKFFIHEVRTSTILVFDQTGKYLYKIGSRGGGPGEHVSLTRFLLDEKKRMLMIYDGISQKMIYYSVDGGFVKQIVDFSDRMVIRDICNLPDGRFICYKPEFSANGRPNVWEVDSTGKPGKVLIHHGIQYPVIQQFESYFNQLSNGKVGLWLADADDIYHFGDNNEYKYLSMKLNRKTVTDFPNEDNDDLQMMRKSTVIEKDNFLLVDWYISADNDRYDNYMSVFFKADNKTIFGRGINYRTNRIDAIRSLPNFEYNVPNQMLQVIYASSLEYYLFKNTDISQQRKDMLKSMFEDEEDNPILQIFHLK